MRASARSLILCAAGWLSAPFAIASAPAASVPEEVRRLCQEAVASQTDSAADRKLNEAEAKLDSVRREMNSREHDFQENEIKYTRGVICVTRWQRNRRNTAAGETGRRCLQEAVSGYDRLARLSELDAGDIEQVIGSSDLARNDKYRTASGNIDRANYKKAWAEYWLGMATEDSKERETHFNSAEKGFLNFTAGGYHRDPHQVIAYSFIGQARCLFELKRYWDVKEVLDPDPAPAQKEAQIIAANMTPEAFAQVTELRLKAYQALGYHMMEEDRAQRYFDALPADHKLDATELDMVLIRAHSLAKLVTDPNYGANRQDYQQRLTQLGERLQPYGEPWRQRLVEALNQAGIETPLRYLEEARRLCTNQRYEESREAVRKGLLAAGDDAESDDLRAQLRLISLRTHQEQKSWPEAHRTAVEFLKRHPKHRQAAEVADIVIKSGLLARQSKPALPASELMASLEYVEKTFPQFPEVRKVPLYRAQLLLEAGEFSSAQKILDGIGSDSPVYRQAQLHSAQARFVEAESARQAGRNTAQELARLYAGIADPLGRYADSTPATATHVDSEESRFAGDLAVVTAERLLRIEGADPNVVQAFLKRVQPLQDATGGHRDRWVAVRVEADIATGDLDTATGLLDGLLQRKPADPDVAVALINCANRLEQTRAHLAGQDKRLHSVDERLAGIYRFLVDHTAKSADKIMRDKEPAVHLRLAECMARLEQYASAVAHYEYYVGRVSTPSADALRGLAAVYEQTEKYEPALQQWRTLYARLPRGTTEWIEAAYHVVRCHMKTGNPSRARETLAYFRTLCPRSKLGQWEERFDALERACAATEGRAAP